MEYGIWRRPVIRLRNYLAEKSCCFTGHRHITEEERPILCSWLRHAIRELITTDGITTFYAGGALGFDTLAATMVVEAREVFPTIRLVIVLPYAKQEDRWSDADEVICLSEQYYTGCMFARNRYLVDHSSICVSYQTRQSGGTAYTVKYATARGLRIINLAQFHKANTICVI
ncbi:MAG: DUF1273 family protein [Paludibacteraceae bacterium]|nr:DUF1273 family protein [Paludibacteraceae bacterium]